MLLVDLITHLVEAGTLDELLIPLGVPMDSEQLSVYRHDELRTDSSILVLGIEETAETLDYQKQGVNYVQLLPLYEVVEIAQGGLQAHYSPAVIAQRIVEYASNDA